MSETKEYIKICPVCGKEFTTLNKRRIYCCANCNAASHRDRHRVKFEKVCPICEKLFIANRSADVYCSDDCRAEAKVIYRNEHKVVREPENRTCPICGKQFTTTISNKIYCSSKCKDKSGRIAHKEQNRIRSRLHYAKNKEKYKEWERANREKRLLQKHEYYLKHKEEKKEYAKLHKEEIRINKRNLHHKRKSDPIYRIKRKCRDFVHRCIEGKKLYKTSAILMYSPEELKKRLESNFYGGMNWYVRNWEIHHIKPLETFNFLNEDGTDNYEVIREANALENLIPLFIEDHKELTSLYNSEERWLNEEEIKEFIKGKGNG